MQKSKKSAVLLFVGAAVAAFLYLFLPLIAPMALLFLFVTSPQITGYLAQAAGLLHQTLPSFFNIFLALGLAYLLPIPTAFRLLAAFLLSFVLGLNTTLLALPQVFMYSPKYSWNVEEVLTLSASRRERMPFKSRQWPTIFTQPFVSRVGFGGNEGCMCVYFEEEIHTYLNDLNRTIREVAPREIGGSINLDVATNYRGALADLRIETKDNAAEVTLEISKEGKRTAIFTHRGIPFQALNKPRIVHWSLKDNFMGNFSEALFQNNFWNSFAARLFPGYFPSAEVKKFLQEALKPET